MDNQETTVEKITLDDLRAIIRLIDIMSKRGAIQPIEMTGVGILYEKIVRFVAQSEKESNQDKLSEK